MTRWKSVYCLDSQIKIVRIRDRHSLSEREFEALNAATND